MIVMKADEDVPLWSLSPAVTQQTRHPDGGPSPLLGCAIEDDGHPFGHCQSIIIWKWLIRWMGGTQSPRLAWLFVWGGPGWSTYL